MREIQSIGEHIYEILNIFVSVYTLCETLRLAIWTLGTVELHAKRVKI
jgi:hypothetical protein